MDKITPRTLSGFMELLPEKQAVMEMMLSRLRRTYSLCGFAPLDTPAIESAEVLLAKGGGETEKQIYRFSKGDSDLALRFDLTVPLAKYVAANYSRLVFPFRRYQIGKVWRGERAQRGRFREFYQADIDIIGDGVLSVANEAEIPAIICRTFSSLGLKDFTVRINNRKLLSGFFELMGFGGMSAEIMRSVDKLEKIGAEKLLAVLTGETGMSADKAGQLLEFISFSGTPDEKLAFLESYRGKNAVMDEGIDELALVLRYLPLFGVPAERFTVDFTIARGLDYYTGTVYETSVNSHPEIGSVCSGGRYDNLAGYYTDKKLPGVGISIGLTRLFYILDEQGMLNSELITAPADAVILPMTENLDFAAGVSAVLRGAGVRTQVYCEDRKFKQKMSYASKLAVPFAVIIGEDEIKEGVVSLKDMRSGNQISCSPEAAAEEIRARLSGTEDLPIII